MRTVIVIPARFNSSRLPGKPLADILGKPMVQHVYEKAVMSACADEVVVATDDARVYDTVVAFGGKAVMTSAAHQSGTDRLAEVAKQLPADFYINLQGDEPLVRLQAIRSIAEAFNEDPTLQVVTLAHSISATEAIDPNCVKLVMNSRQDALYFSRAPIPFAREGRPVSVYYKHIGIYGYSAQTLAHYTELPASTLEADEKLEQLRLLEAGIPIRVLLTKPSGPGVDTPESLELVREAMRLDCDAKFWKWWSAPKESREDPTPLSAMLEKIKLVVTDIDGVMTDGSLYYVSGGEGIKQFNVRDGLGVKLLQNAGIAVAVASGRSCPALSSRLVDLGIQTHVLANESKADSMRSLASLHKVDLSEVLYIGDDIPDLAAFKEAGVAVTVGDAPSYVKAEADLVLDAFCGRGAFRELADRLLQAKGLNPCSVYR
jgi:3-deoxy-D-manno-octulosonate 8-phosphate phosphatase (KDO 8-P phosphatase)